MMRTYTAAAMAALYAASPASAIVRNCPGGSSGACFSWATPQTTSTGSVYFSIEAPTSFSWVGLGLGSGMAGAEMFIVYQDGSGNVTLSTRSAPGHVEPSFVQRNGVELLAGSGVVDGKMVANVKCSGDCSQNMDRSGSNNWIAAWRSGGSLQSTDTSADISKHNSDYNFGIDMAQATISSDSNPFLSSSQNGGSTSGNSNSNSNGNGNSNASPDSTAGVTSGTPAVSGTVLTAHGVIMAVTFAFLYPVGSILMPMLGKWLVHGVFQMVAFLMMWAGFGLGYYYSSKLNIFWSDTHMKIGVICVALLGIQPILGWFHHNAYKRYERRTIISHIHIWYGRGLMVLGIVNGGLGLKSAKQESKYKIAYAIVAGVFGGLYIGAAIWGAVKRRQSPRATSKGSGTSGSE